MMAGKKVFMLLSNPFRPDPRVLKEAKALVRAGHRVTIIAWDRVGGREKLDLMEDVSVVRFGPIAGFDNFLSMIMNLPRFYFRAFRYLVRRQPDIIHCHDFDTLPIGILTGWLCGSKIVYDSHESYPDMIADSVPAFAAKLIAIDERLAIKRADAVIGTTSAIGKKFRKYGAKEVVTIMNCAEARQSPDDRKIEEMRDRFGAGEKTVIGYVGTMERIRGLEEIVDAFSEYSGNDFLFVLGGYGPTEKILKARSRKTGNVKYIGPVPPDKVELLNHSFDIMILLSDSENMQTQYCIANKVFEAMAAGKPIIVTKNTLHQKLVEGVGCGLAIDYVDPKALFKAFERLSKDKELYSRMSENGQRAAAERFNWNEMAVRLTELYERLYSQILNF